MSVERILVCNVIENLVEHGNTVCHAPIPMTSKICYPNNYDVILMSK